MFLTGDPVFESFAIATIAVVAIAMIGSLTVLPALLSRLGDRVDRGRVPLVRRLRRDDGESRIWGAIVTASCAGRSCPPSSPVASWSRWLYPHSSSAWSSPARTRSRSRSPPCRRTSGCSRRSPAPPCRPTSSSRLRTCSRRRCRPRSSGFGTRRWRPAACTSRSPSNQRRRDGREHRSADRRHGHRLTLERVARAAAGRDRAGDGRRRPRAPRQASPARPPSGRTARTR